LDFWSKILYLNELKKKNVWDALSGGAWAYNASRRDGRSGSASNLGEFGLSRTVCNTRKKRLSKKSLMESESRKDVRDKLAWLTTPHQEFFTKQPSQVV
jgi:hypothetical protein